MSSAWCSVRWRSFTTGSALRTRPAVVEAILDFAGLEYRRYAPRGRGRCRYWQSERAVRRPRARSDLPRAEPRRWPRWHGGTLLSPECQGRETSFEDWQPTANSYGLVLQLSPGTGSRPRRVMSKRSEPSQPGGTLALFWNVMLLRETKATAGVECGLWRAQPAMGWPKANTLR